MSPLTPSYGPLGGRREMIARSDLRVSSWILSSHHVRAGIFIAPGHWLISCYPHFPCTAICHSTEVSFGAQCSVARKRRPLQGWSPRVDSATPSTCIYSLSPSLFSCCRRSSGWMPSSSIQVVPGSSHGTGILSHMMFGKPSYLSCSGTGISNGNKFAAPSVSLYKRREVLRMASQQSTVLRPA